MVTRHKWALGLFAAALLGGIYWSVLRPTEQRIIRRQMDEMTELFAKNSGEAQLEALQKAARIGTYFADKCDVTLPSTPTATRYSRKDITDRVILLRGGYATLDVKIHDLAVTLMEAGHAQALMTVRLTGEQNRIAVADVQEVEVTWAKQEGDWVITDATVVEILTKE